MVQIMESTQVLRKYIDFVRYDKPYISLSFMVTITIGTVAILSNCMVIITEQNNKEKCLMGIKDLIMVTAAFSSVANISMNPQRMLHMVSLIEKECLVSNRKLAGRERNWKTVEKCYSKKKIEMETMYKNISYVLIVVYIGAVNRNLVSSLMTKTSDNNESKDWPTPFVYWCPSGHDSFLFFILVYIFQSVQLSIMCFQGYFTEVLVCLATEKVLADFETIILLLEGIANDYPHLDYLQPEFQNGALDDDDLKKDMKLIVQCHQTLNRNFKDCTEISAYGILVNTFIISFDTVFNIYLMLKANDIGTSVNYAIASFFINLIGFFRFHTGHGIVEQNDVFRQALSNVAWTDKPGWLRSALLIMMARANTDTAIKPYDLFILDHKSFKNIMKSVFTYGNFLYTRHSMNSTS